MASMLVKALTSAATRVMTRGKVIPPPDDEILTHQGTAVAHVLPNQLLKVLVWNVRKGKERTFAVDFERLASGKHLVLLQEYLGSPAVHKALLTGSMRYDVASSFLYEAEEEGQQRISTGVATGGIAPALDVRAEVTEDREPVVNTPKATIITWYAVEGGGQLLVLNIHGRNRGGLEPFAKQLQCLSQYIESHEGPVLLAGDFNTNNAEKKEWLMRYARRIHLQPVAFDPDTRTASKLSRQPLDWVFVRGMTVEESSVPVVSGSDHQPMIVTFNS